MPNGYVLFGPTPRPWLSSTEPLVLRLFPLHPGYVMTTWEETKVVRVRSESSMEENERMLDSILAL